jgi:alanine racemase
MNWLRRVTTTYKPANRVELSRSRLLGNIKLMADLTKQNIIPVLKSNAYGHGILEIADILNQAPIEMVAVDGYFEAHKIRHIIKHKILVMGYIDPNNLPLLDTRKISFVAQEPADVEAWGKLDKKVNIHLELNTGMNRMGINPDELDTYLAMFEKYPKLRLEGVMTHLADADNPDDLDFTHRQLQIFDAAVAHVLAAGFHPRFVHISQTAGSIKVKSQHANCIRLGIGAYGINPLSPKDPYHKKLEKLQPVLALRSRIVKVRELEKGDKVSYGVTFTAPKSMRIGVLPLGYYEGVPRALSGKGSVTYKGHVLPILGRVCMNHVMIDITGTDLKLGSSITVISRDKSAPNSIISWEREYGLFAYETIARLSSTTYRNVVE